MVDAQKLTDDCWLQVNKDSSGNMFASSSLTEEGIERVISTPNSFVARHLTVRLNAMLQTVEFPAGIAHLDSGLAHVHWNTLTLLKKTDKKNPQTHIRTVHTSASDLILAVVSGS